MRTNHHKFKDAIRAYLRALAAERERSYVDAMGMSSAMVARCYLYIYQRKNLLAEKAGKSKPFLEYGSISLTQFVNGNNYKISIAVSAIWDNVYRYTAQKSRFIMAASAQANAIPAAGSGVERGIDLWAFSTNEKDKGLFEQFLREATGLFGIEYNDATLTLTIKKYSIITAGMLAAWHGMQEDRHEQAKYRAGSTGLRCAAGCIQNIGQC